MHIAMATGPLAGLPCLFLAKERKKKKIKEILLEKKLGKY